MNEIVLTHIINSRTVEKELLYIATKCYRFINIIYCSLNKFALELNLYNLFSTYRVHNMKNTFTTPSAQQFGL